ncbi:MAG: glycerol kinase GlpK [Candidatus Omnitrophica bacterium]|nr:glycerol kinase GlpK [Candidatus Omnitrophota bacterium]
MKYILALDQGTTGSRAVVYDKRGNVAASSYYEFSQYFPQPGWVEHDPIDIWRSVNRSIQTVLKKVDSSEIAAIGLTNQRETAVLWDRESGRPVYNAICWQCRRTSKRCQELIKKNSDENFFKQRTGLPLDAYFSATKVEWLLKNVSGLRAKAKQGKLCFGTTDSWVLWNLTKGAVHSTDYTNASRTMLFNINSLDWDDSLLKIFNVPRSILPRVYPSSFLYGRTERIGKLNSSIPIAGIAGDQQAALFGQGCFSPGMVKNTYGTGSFILLNAGNCRPESKHGLIVTLGCSLTEKQVYVLEGSVFVSGAAIQWLRDGLKVLKTAGDSELLARSVKDTGGVYFVPAFVGLGAPFWKHDSRGLISGLTRGTSKAHLVRAALESMAYQTKDVLSAMEKDSRLKIKSLKIDGGASANDFLCQFQSDILGVKVLRPKNIEVTSLGVAYLAGLTVNYWENLQAIKKNISKDKIFSPKMTSAAASRLYQGWQQSVKRTLMV